MREILFRAKRKDNGDWVEGVPLTEMWSKKTYIITFEYSSLVFIQQIEVDPTTVCQFTGLTDKNGTKIFEGDILRIGLKDNVVVEWHKEQAKFELKLGTHYVAGFNEFTMEHYEVIGNIIDNPELLEQDNR